LFNFKALLNELKKHKKELILANIIAFFAVVVSTPAPLLIPLLVDEVLLGSTGRLVNTIDSIFGGQNPAYFYIGIVLFLTIFLRAIFFTLGVWQNYIFTKISQSIVFNMRKDLLGHLKNLDLGEYQRFSSAKISSLMVVDLATIETFLSTSISRLIISILTVIGVSIVLLLIEWRLALLILFLNPFILFFTTKMGRRVGQLKRKENSLISVFSESLSETLDFYEQVKASNKSEHFIKKLIGKADEVKEISTSFRYKSDASAKFSFLLFLSGFEIFRAAGIFMVFYEDLTIGLMLAVFGYLWVIMTPIQEIINIQYSYFNAKAALKRVNELFLLKVEPEVVVKLYEFKGAIEVKNLKFSYAEKEILKGIDLRVESGSKVAIVGGSGSGKTTLVKILAGFFAESSGEIYYDGVNTQDIGLKQIRANSFLVLQSPQLFNNTLRYNLTYGEEIDEDTILKAIDIAELGDFIDSHEKGLDTMLGREGVSLSGGERQRVSIARMIVKNPKIIFLDESTSALDTVTESKLFAKLQTYLQDKTVVMIAHRINTIKSADFIYALEDGVLNLKSIEDL